VEGVVGAERPRPGLRSTRWRVWPARRAGAAAAGAVRSSVRDGGWRAGARGGGPTTRVVVGAVGVEVEGVVGTEVGGDVGALISLLLWSLLLAAPIVLH